MATKERSRAVAVISLAFLASAIAVVGCGGEQTPRAQSVLLSVLERPRSTDDALPRGGRGVAPDVGLDPSTTRKVTAGRIRGSLWVGTGSRGICVMSYPPGADGLGTTCFAPEIVRDGKAVTVARQGTGFIDVYGVVAGKFTSAEIHDARGRLIAKVMTNDNIWAVSIRKTPSYVRLRGPAGVVHVSVPPI